MKPAAFSTFFGSKLAVVLAAFAVASIAVGIVFITNNSKPDTEASLSPRDTTVQVSVTESDTLECAYDIFLDIDKNIVYISVTNPRKAQSPVNVDVVLELDGNTVTIASYKSLTPGSRLNWINAEQGPPAGHYDALVKLKAVSVQDKTPLEMVFPVRLYVYD